MLIADTIIVINSSNRASIVKTHTVFPKEIIHWVIAIPIEQKNDYLQYFTEDQLLLIPERVHKSLGAQRQWCMDSLGHSVSYVWFMDDDLSFFHRVPNMGTSLKKSELQHIGMMFTTVRKHMEEVPIVSISRRFGNNFVKEDYDEINRSNACYCINTTVFKEVGAVFNPIEPFVAEDFHMVLSFLNAGHKNRILHTYAWDDGGANKEGGCSVYRTADVQKKTMEWLAANHPEVKIVIKQNKTGWNLPGSVNNERVDCNIQWKKAYKPKRQKTGGLNFLFAKKK